VDTHQRHQLVTRLLFGIRARRHGGAGFSLRHSEHSYTLETQTRWGALGEAKANRVWFYVWDCLYGVLTPIHIPHGIAGGLLLVWYFSLGKNQVAYVKEKWGNGYERKPWTTPLLIASCCLLSAIVVFVVAKELAIGLR
jgi:hypothetical protein